MEFFTEFKLLLYWTHGIPGFCLTGLIIFLPDRRGYPSEAKRYNKMLLFDKKVVMARLISTVLSFSFLLYYNTAVS
jgi:hypothetical protein